MTDRGPGHVLALALCALTLGVAGCGDSGSNADPPDAGDPREAAAFRALVTSTEAALVSFWSERLPALTDAAWKAPRLAIYTEDRPPAGSACMAADDPQWADNSFYCPPDGALYLDRDFLLTLTDGFGGPATGIVTVQAHEFGHHLQRLARSDPVLRIGDELQADCYAGVFLSAVGDGDTRLDADAVSAFAAINAMRDSGDQDFSDAAWFAPDAHGGPVQRAQAMATGYIGGDARLCAAYERTGPIKPLSLPDYEFTPPAATDVEPRDGGGFALTSADGQRMLVQEATGLGGQDAVDDLKAYLPGYFSGSTVEYVGGVEPFDAAMQGYDVATARYGQLDDGSAYHGVVVLVTRGDGTGLVLDSYEEGPRPADDAGWESLGDYTFSALWGAGERPG